MELSVGWMVVTTRGALPGALVTLMVEESTSSARSLSVRERKMVRTTTSEHVTSGLQPVGGNVPRERLLVSVDDP